MNPLLIGIPDQIETRRLVLRAPRGDEVEEMHKAILESIGELKPWMPWANPTPEIDAIRIYSQTCISKHAAREEICHRIYLRESNRYAGNVTLLRMDWSVRRFEIGYWLRTSLTGQGFMTEAVNAMTALAFDRFKAVRVEIRADELNVRSCHVAERAGFELEGVLRHEQRDTTGRLQNMRVYSKIKFGHGD